MLDPKQPTPCSPKPTGQNHRSQGYPDHEFWKENPDEASAYEWFAGIYWPDSVRCLTRCRGGVVRRPGV